MDFSRKKWLESDHCLFNLMINLRNTSLNFDYLFAVENYQPLIDELGNVAKAIPDAQQYVQILQGDVEAQKQAVLSGDKAAMGRTVMKGAKDTKKGAKSVESDPELYELADQKAPKALRGLAAGFAKGTKDAKDENDLMGEFDKLVEAALAN